MSQVPPLVDFIPVLNSLFIFPNLVKKGEFSSWTLIIYRCREMRVERTNYYMQALRRTNTLFKTQEILLDTKYGIFVEIVNYSMLKLVSKSNNILR